jgi:hypothetical protein
MQVYLALKEFSKPILQINKCEKIDPRLWLELDQHVDVTVWPEIAAQDRAKERQLANAMPLAKVSNFGLGNHE